MSDPIGAVAVIGMAGRFPGAADVERFWENLRAGVHSITFFDAEEGETDPALVRAAGALEGIDRFDAPCSSPVGCLICQIYPTGNT